LHSTPSPHPFPSLRIPHLLTLLAALWLLPLAVLPVQAQEPEVPDLPDVPVQIPEGPEAQGEPAQGDAPAAQRPDRSRTQRSPPASGEDDANVEDAAGEEGEEGEEGAGDEDEEAKKALPEGTLRVGVKDAPPFAIKGEQGWSGIAVEMWQDVAGDLGYEYQLEERTLDGLLTGLQDGSLDAAVAALSITSQREDVIDFTHPFYETGQGIAVNTSQGSWGLGIRRLFSPELLKFLGVLIVLMLVVGFLMYLLERRANEEQFGGPHHHGLGQGFWWSAVTMTTVGYGDKAPKTFLGRLLGLVWMFSGVVIISVFTAAITSTLTVASLDETPVQSVGDLQNVDVGTVPNTAAAEALAARGIEPEMFGSLPEALDALKSDDVNAVVYDAALLRYRVQQRGEDLRVLPVTFNQQAYGIGLPEGSPLREELNRRMPDEISAERYRKRLRQYLGDEEN
jgi:polar amino acid transport system substrate-binding protein